MSALFDFFRDHYGDLKALDYVAILVIVALLAFAIFRFVNWIYQERLQSKEAVIGDYDRRLNSANAEVDELRQRLTDADEKGADLARQLQEVAQTASRQALVAQANAANLLLLLMRLGVLYNIVRIASVAKSAYIGALPFRGFHGHEAEIQVLAEIEQAETDMHAFRRGIQDIPGQVGEISRLSSTPLEIPSEVRTFDAKPYEERIDQLVDVTMKNLHGAAHSDQ
jgi:type II secretory pathway pseudopilin PulG